MNDDARMDLLSLHGTQITVFLSIYKFKKLLVNFSKNNNNNITQNSWTQNKQSKTKTMTPTSTPPTSTQC